ncbi:molybdopterin-binding protein [Pseudonocardia sediminis]|uniref:Molybdopterin-binding protein n=1 Tax=Pseudonocardia sediminis TaxID=1397368 RepID=A0A4V2FQQ9_PSEST|nr:TOBE domain-containing protein [Pseudonocardia sediminis]RZT85680.1 molybdopterin-binding protein [Pseudonocardia sediminis]
MAFFRISFAADLLGVSNDTVRRWIESGTLPATTDASNVKVVDGLALAALCRDHAIAASDPLTVQTSARNRFVGLVTEVETDPVMAQVEIQSGSHRVVSLMTSESVQELGLVPGELAVAVVKSTDVIIEVPRK